MKNKKTIAAISAAVGACMLTTAAVAGYQSANGYDELKKSILATADYTNCTTNVTAAINVDGTEVMGGDILTEIDVDNGIEHRMETSTSAGVEKYVFDSYCYNGYQYYYNYVDGEKYNKYKYASSRPNLWGIEDEDRPMVDKMLNFMEIAADTVVGDLRNNFVCTGENEDYTSYSVTLDSVQVPELINAGISMLFSMENNYSGNADELTPDDSDYYFLLMGSDPVLDSVEFNYDVNKDGTFRAGTMTAVFKGNGHEMASTTDYEISKVGSTAIQTLEEQGAKIVAMD